MKAFVEWLLQCDLHDEAQLFVLALQHGAQFQGVGPVPRLTEGLYLQREKKLNVLFLNITLHYDIKVVKVHLTGNSDLKKFFGCKTFFRLF